MLFIPRDNWIHYFLYKFIVTQKFGVFFEASALKEVRVLYLLST